MPVLKNARHEAFAQALAKGMTRDHAYSEAGYKPDRKNAFRLTTNDDIMSRVEELSARIADKAEWSAAERLSSLKAIHDASLNDDRRTAIAAIAEANKMNGSYAPSKHELAGRNGGPIQTIEISRLKGMSNEELDVLERALIQIGLAEGDQGGEGKQED